MRCMSCCGKKTEHRPEPAGHHVTLLAGGQWTQVNGRHLREPEVMGGSWQQAEIKLFLRETTRINA